MKQLSVLFITVLMALPALTKAQVVTEPPRDGIYDQVTVGEKGIVPYDHIREADVFWEKRVWRVIELSEKKNLPFKYPKQYFVNILREHALEGTLTVYSGLDDEFTSPLTPDDIAEIGAGANDSIEEFDLNTGASLGFTQITNEFNPENIKKFRIKEAWVFDEETSTMVVRIIGIAPILEVIDDQGNIRGDQVMFWVYYPEAREILSKYQVFNPRNDAVTLSWEDIFELRYFGSYIMKISNVYDRRIQDYAVGVDALYEADRITNMIFDFEQSLWSY